MSTTRNGSFGVVDTYLGDVPVTAECGHVIEPRGLQVLHGGERFCSFPCAKQANDARAQEGTARRREEDDGMAVRMLLDGLGVASVHELHRLVTLARREERAR